MEKEKVSRTELCIYIGDEERKEKEKDYKTTTNSAVYFMIIGKINGNMNITIHRTYDIETENNNKVISSIYRVDRLDDFYNFIINHPFVKNSLQINGESYIFTLDDYKKLLKLAKKQVPYYINNFEAASNEEVLFTPKQININRGSKIQKYTTDGKLVKTYIGIRETSRQEFISDTTLKSAIVNKSIYAGHRWLYLDRSLPDNTFQEIGESLKVNKYKNTLIAMLDIDKTKIVSIFTNQKEASIARKLKSSSAIFHSLTNGTISSGHYFKYYNDCSDELKQAYIELNGKIPEIHTPNKGLTVKQINHVTGETIKEFSSLLEIQKQFQISNKCLKKAIQTCEVIKGFKWSY